MSVLLVVGTPAVLSDTNPRGCRRRGRRTFFSKSRQGDITRPWNKSPSNGPYVLRMSTSLEVRRSKFAYFVKNALETAKSQRGWTVAKVLEVTGVGKTTLYRWMEGDWTEDPNPTKVRDFCDGLDIPVERAFRILWAGKLEKPLPTEPAPMDPDVLVLLRMLADPNTNEKTKAFIRNALRSLSALADEIPQSRPRKRKAAG